MSDTKLRPEDLTSEERAIVDNAALFYRQVTGDVGETAEWAYVEALKEAEPIILARRALFAPAPEKVAKVECPNCGEMTSESHADGILFGTEKYMAALRRKSAYGRPRTDYEEQSCPVFSFAYSDGFVNFEPAPPEPAAPVNGSTPVGEYDPDMKPAAREMTTIRPYTAKDVRAWIAARGYLSAEQYNDFGRVLPTSNMGACMEALAEALEEIERNLAQPVAVGMTEALETVLIAATRCAREEQYAAEKLGMGIGYAKKIDAAIATVRQQAAQPVAVGMTEELKRVLDFAAVSHKDANADTRVLWDQEYLVAVGKAIAAVRQQAAQGRKVELGKVRDYFNTPSALRTVGDERAALAELDAAEGKGEGRG